MENWEFYRRIPVYVEDGSLLGPAIEVGHAVDYIHVQQGRFLVRDWYIPIDAVGTVTDAGVFLRVSASDVRARRWNVPPEELLRTQGATPGYEYTSRADIPSYGAAKGGGSEAGA